MIFNSLVCLIPFVSFSIAGAIPVAHALEEKNNEGALGLSGRDDTAQVLSALGGIVKSLAAAVPAVTVANTICTSSCAAATGTTVAKSICTSSCATAAVTTTAAAASVSTSSSSSSGLDGLFSIASSFMKSLDGIIGKIDWSSLFKSLGDSLDKIDWSSLMKSASSAFGSIDWSSILGGKDLSSILGSFSSILGGDLSSILGSFSSILGGMDFSSILGSLGSLGIPSILGLRSESVESLFGAAEAFIKANPEVEEAFSEAVASLKELVANLEAEAHSAAVAQSVNHALPTATAVLS